MADDDCPHRKHLEESLRQCQHESALLASTRKQYVHLIDEFKQDLDEIIVEVQQQSTVHTHTAVSSFADAEVDEDIAETARMPCALEQAVQELQAHSARLEAALNARLLAEAERTTSPIRWRQEQQQHDQKCQTESETNNEQLAAQVQCLTDTLEDRDKQITQLNSIINSFSDFCDSKRSNEITEQKKKNCEQARRIRELAALIKHHQDERVDLRGKYEKLQRDFEEQGVSLKQASCQMEMLQQRFQCMEKQQDELKQDRKLLREEVIALKDKEAKMLGIERSLRSHLQQQEAELCRARHLVEEMQCMLRRDDESHKAEVARLQHVNGKMKKEMCELMNTCKQIQDELKQQVGISKQKEQIIDSYHKWRDAQIKADESTRNCIKRAEEHIADLIEDNSHLMQEYKTLSRDYCIIEAELQRCKNCVVCRNSTEVRSLAGDDAMQTRLTFLSKTSKRLAEQKRTLSGHALNSRMMSCNDPSASRSGQNLS